jgi:hypothetical protein
MVTQFSMFLCSNKSKAVVAIGQPLLSFLGEDLELGIQPDHALAF